MEGRANNATKEKGSQHHQLPEEHFTPRAKSCEANKPTTFLLITFLLARPTMFHVAYLKPKYYFNISLFHLFP
jgi:hypothetical protein